MPTICSSDSTVLASRFLSLADCYGAAGPLDILRERVAALAIQEQVAASSDVAWLSASPPLPAHSREAVRKGVGALYAALRGLRGARLSMALRRWSVNAARASIVLVLPPSSNAARLSLDNGTLSAELSRLEAEHAQQSVELHEERRRSSECVDRRLSELVPGLVYDGDENGEVDDWARLGTALTHERIEALEASVFPVAPPRGSFSGGSSTPGSPDNMPPRRAPWQEPNDTVGTPRTPQHSTGRGVGM